MSRSALLLVAMASAASAIADPALPDCAGTYPHSSVEQALADAKYKQCSGVLLGYTGYVTMQIASLQRLRPVYERELVAKEDKNDEEGAKKKTRTKLTAFDEALTRMKATVKPPTLDGPASGPATAASKTAVRKWLQPIKVDSQRLSDRLNEVGAVLKGDDLAAFCLHDFHTRVSTELEKKLAGCVQP